jgi:hypothetical protein
MRCAGSIAIAGHRRVLEDGPEFCSSESEAEYSDRREELTGIYTPGMLGEDGKPVLARATMTTEQEDRLREQGRTGGLPTVSGIG